MPDLPTTKICSRCPVDDNVKPLSQFFKNKGYRDGLYPYCKACHKKAEARPERVAKRTAYKAQYHVEHAETINARSVQWGKEHPERMVAKNKKSKTKKLLAQVEAGEREMPKVYLNRLESLAAGEKRCSQCGKVKALGEYYAWTQSPDGAQAECKVCHDGRYNPVHTRDMNITEKTCSVCGAYKPAREFYDDPAAKTGIRAACKMCIDMRNDKWEADNPDKRRAISRKWFKKAWHDPSKQPTLKARVGIWRRNNPAGVRKHRLTDLRRNGQKPARLDNRRRYKQRFFAERPGYRRAASHKRRAVLRNATIVDTLINVWMLYDRDHGICTLCNEPVYTVFKWPDLRMATIDHHISLTLGGEHSYANTKLAHHYCNTLKNNRLETPEILASIREQFMRKFTMPDIITK